MHLFPDPVVGYEQIWIFGDEFVTRSFTECVQQKGVPKEKQEKYFMSDHYEVIGFARSKFLSNNQLLLGRIRNQIIAAINQEILLP